MQKTAYEMRISDWSSDVCSSDLFHGTALASLLSAYQCDSLIVTGCTTSGCVRASVVDAMQNGFPPFVPADCVADRSKAQHDSNLVDMASKYAQVDRKSVV